MKRINLLFFPNIKSSGGKLQPEIYSSISLTNLDFESISINLQTSVTLKNGSSTELKILSDLF